MAFGPRALRMALDYRAQLAPGVPIVFMGVDSVDDFALPGDVTGVLFTFAWMDTLDAALRLQPETRPRGHGRGNRPARQALVGRGSQGICRRAGSSRVYLTDLPLDAVTTKLAALPDRTIVLLIGFLQDSTGRNFTAQETVERFVERSRAPIYGFSSTRIGYGIVGGRLTDWERHGVKAGELGARLLRGEKLGPADIVTGTRTLMFDARQLGALGSRRVGCRRAA